MTIEELMEALPGAYRPEKANGWNCRFHFMFEEAQSPEWTVAIADGACTVERGLHGTADCEVRTKEKTYVGIAEGTVNPQFAFLTGKVKVTDIVSMMQLMKVFPRD